MGTCIKCGAAIPRGFLPCKECGHRQHTDDIPEGASVVTGDWDTQEVHVDSEALYNPYDSGDFAWGTEGNGSERLAMALLLQVTSEGEARQMSPIFAREIIARIGKMSFSLPLLETAKAFLNLYARV